MENRSNNKKIFQLKKKITTSENKFVKIIINKKCVTWSMGMISLNMQMVEKR